MNTQYVLSLSYGKDSLACLEAVKQLGLPLDRIIHAEVWATPTIPADLPPMVEFKKKADKIIKERYGITVEHITATKPNGGGTTPLKVNFTLQEKIKFLGEPYMASLVLSIRGAIANLKSMRCQKLTYEDIFYRQVKTRSGGGERRFTASRCFEDNGAIQPSRCQQSKNYGLPYEVESILHGRTQTLRTYGFPVSVKRGNWCTQLKTRVFRKPEHYGRYKYSAVFGNCRRRTRTNSPASAEREYSFAVGGNRLG